MGLSSRVGADLIFTRGFGNSEARDWKPNVAARHEWHYRIRRPNDRDLSPGRSFWNWLDSGIGLHLASLDQGSDSVEIGLGVNVSFWEGLLSGGYGHNLNTDRQYVFVGLNLLNILTQAQQQFQ